MTLDDFLHDYAPDGEFGDCFDVIFLTFSDLHQPPFAHFHHYLWFRRALESRGFSSGYMTMLPLWGEYTTLIQEHHHQHRRLPRKRNINKIIKKDALGYSKLEIAARTP